MPPYAQKQEENVPACRHVPICCGGIPFPVWAYFVFSPEEILVLQSMDVQSLNGRQAENKIPSDISL